MICSIVHKGEGRALGAVIHDGLVASGDVAPVYVIFEGGGAKGITHIGAFRALYDKHLRPIGVGGTSAGAIIAALVAVGYQPDQLFSQDGKTNVLGDKTPLDLLGRIGWHRYCLIRDFTILLLVTSVAAAVGAHWWLGTYLVFGGLLAWQIIQALRTKPAKKRGAKRVVAGATAAMALLYWALDHWAVFGAQTLMSAFVAGPLLLLLVLIWPVIWQRGLFDPTRVRDQLDALLRAKMEEHYDQIGRPKDELQSGVRFRHLRGLRVCVPLKIIVTNARTGRVRLFDEHDENVVVADAVAASAAIPFFFRSPKVRGAGDDTAIYVDGGLVSNLPSWAFREEKRAWERRKEGPPVPILAFTLNDQNGTAPAAKGKPGLVDYVGKIMAAGMFGSQKVLQDFVPDLIVIDLPTPLTTLAFHCGKKAALDAYVAGRDEAGKVLERSQVFTRATNAALRALQRDVEDMIRARRKAARKPMPKLRFNIIDPVERRSAPGGQWWHIGFRIVATAGMDSDADDRLELDPENDAAPAAFRSGNVVRKPLQNRTAQQLCMTKYEHALVSKHAVSVLCVPVSPHRAQTEAPERVVCVDSTDSLEDEENDAAFVKELRGKCALLSRTLLEGTLENKA